MSETNDLPCVYGIAIMKTCPVRAALGQPTIEKYRQSVDPSAQQVKEIAASIAAANNIQWLPMPSFCASCPHLHRYNVEQEAEK